MKYDEALDILGDLKCEPKYEYLKAMALADFKELIDNYSMLEKALDKACEFLNTNNGIERFCPCDLNLKDCDKTLCLDSKECWKDYLLSEVSK